VLVTLEAPARRDLYLLIARLFREEVDAPLYRRLLATQSDALLWIEPAIAALTEARALEELETEYCRLFIGPDPVCPPFASVARAEALLGGRARTTVDELLASHGLAIDPGARIASPDHVAVVFAALAELSDPDAIRVCLHRLVLPWVPGWLSALELHAERALFRTLSRLATAVIEQDHLDNSTYAAPSRRTGTAIAGTGPTDVGMVKHSGTRS
jgi:TorA maturation chaperone TorD